ncbi:MAG: hypothetical protein J0L92_07745 [Deltaproteobacteria bacterium]|nr:hypothetical protein [Deltaproteobacteria bacterium]
MASDFAELERGAAAVYGDVSGVWAMILFGRPTKPDMLLARPALAAMSKRAPRGFATLTWVLPEAGLSMDEDARKAAAGVTSEFGAAIRAQATLIELGGFQGATVRAIVAGLDMMSRSSCPKRTFGNLAPALEWCVTHREDPSVTPAVDAMCRTLEGVRASLRTTGRAGRA